MIRKFINHTVELSLLSPAVDATYVDEVSPATAPVQVSCRCRDVTAFQSISLAVQMVSLANQAYTTAKLSWTRGGRSPVWPPQGSAHDWWQLEARSK